MKKVLIITSIYNIDSSLSGIGLRLWELAQSLSDYFNICILAKDDSDFYHQNIIIKKFSNCNWRYEINESDVIITSAMPDTKVLLYAHNINKPIISENAIPIEHLDYHNVLFSQNPDQLYQDILVGFKLQVLISDYFVARSNVERQTLIATLGMMGRINYSTYSRFLQLDKLMTYIPIGFNKYSEQHMLDTEYNDNPVDFVWNGGLWNFYNPCEIPKALQLLGHAANGVMVLFMYIPPAEQIVEEYQKLFNCIDDLNLKDQIKFAEINISHYQRDSLMKRAKALICIGRESIENLTCIRLRLRDVFLYNKPIIVDDFGATAQFVKENNIGICVKNTLELANAIIKIKYDTKYYNRLVENIKRIRADYKFENNMEDLINYIKNPKKAPDKNDIKFRSKLLDFLSQNPVLSSDITNPY